MDYSLYTIEYTLEGYRSHVCLESHAICFSLVIPQNEQNNMTNLDCFPH